MIGLIKKSLFGKIFLIICLTVFLINIIIGIFFRYYMQRGYIPQLMRPVDLFLEYIIRDIGNPPDQKKIDILSEITGFDIYLEGYNQNKSGVDLSLLKHHKWDHHQYGSTQFYFNKGKSVAVKENSGSKIYFIARGNLFSGHDTVLFKIIIIISMILLVSYLMIKRSLKPVKQLTLGMNEIAKGNFDYIIPDQGGDELGRLSLTFNEMNRKLLEMIKLKEQLLYDVSHELRSPLTRVNVALEMIEQNELTESMRDDLRSMEKMIHELLDNGRFSGIQIIVNREKFRVNDLCREIVAKLNTVSNVLLESEELIINGDRGKIEIVLKNIIENAVKYSQPEKPIVISGSLIDGGTTLSIRDHGIGVRQEELDRIFEPFYRTDLSRSRDTGGFGLGLSIAKKIVEAHGGKIWAQSGSDGTVVHIYFPA